MGRPLLALLVLLGAACAGPADRAEARRGASDPASARTAGAAADRGTPPAGTPPAGAVAPGEWTDAFREEVLVVAEAIEIEGPPGLLQRSAVRQDDAVADYDVRAVEGGLLQELSARGAAPVELHGHLDNWTLVAERSLRILRREAEVPVRVRARGRAVWREIATGRERRAEQLEFTGDR